MKKRLLFVHASLHFGGAEKSLQTLLCAIDYLRYDVDLLLLRREGELLELLPPQVNLLELPRDATVSMNFWGFPARMMDALAEGFPAFLTKSIAENPLKGEYFLPSVVESQIDDEGATVRVLTSPDRWFGVTYKEDRQTVVDSLQSMKDKGLYPEKLWK